MFSERLKSERKAKKWTQQQLADKLHIARSNVSNWEANNNGISTELLESLADLFGCSTDYLLGKTDKRTTYEQWDEKFPINKQELSNLEEISKHLTDEQKEQLGFYNFTDENKITGSSALINGLYDMGLLEENKKLTEKQINVILEFIKNNKEMIKFLMEKDGDS
jgi:transcriptional regulator with XRE-family HTH domain